MFSFKSLSYRNDLILDPFGRQSSINNCNESFNTIRCYAVFPITVFWLIRTLIPCFTHYIVFFYFKVILAWFWLAICFTWTLAFVWLVMSWSYEKLFILVERLKANFIRISAKLVDQVMKLIEANIRYESFCDSNLGNELAAPEQLNAESEQNVKNIWKFWK